MCAFHVTSWHDIVNFVVSLLPSFFTDTPALTMPPSAVVNASIAGLAIKKPEKSLYGLSQSACERSLREQCCALSTKLELVSARDAKIKARLNWLRDLEEPIKIETKGRQAQLDCLSRLERELRLSHEERESLNTRLKDANKLRLELPTRDMLEKLQNELRARPSRDELNQARLQRDNSYKMVTQLNTRIQQLENELENANNQVRKYYSDADSMKREHLAQQEQMNARIQQLGNGLENANKSFADLNDAMNHFAFTASITRTEDIPGNANFQTWPAAIAADKQPSLRGPAFASNFRGRDNDPNISGRGRFSESEQSPRSLNRNKKRKISEYYDHFPRIQHRYERDDKYSLSIDHRAISGFEN